MLPTLDNHQIDSLFEEKAYGKDFLGCFSKNGLKKIKPFPKFAVINNANDNQPGTHWVCFYACKNQPLIYFFDSYGAPPANDIQIYLEKVSKKFDKKIIYNTQQIQAFGSDACGWYCIFTLMYLHSGYSFKDVLNNFGPNPHLNDKSLYSYFKKVVDELETNSKNIVYK